VKGKTVAIKVNFIGVRWVAVGQRLDGGHLLDASAHHRRHGQPSGQGRRAPHPGAGRPWSTSESLEEVMLSMNWKPQDILNAAPTWNSKTPITWGAERSTRGSWCRGGGNHLPRLRPEPFLRGLRRLHLARQDEGAFRHGRHALDEEHLRNHSHHHLWPGRGRGRTSIRPHGGRGNVFHFASRVPSKSAPQQIDMSMPRDAGFRAAAHHLRTELRAAGSPGDHRRHYDGHGQRRRRAGGWR